MHGTQCHDIVSSICLSYTCDWLTSGEGQDVCAPQNATAGDTGDTARVQAVQLTWFAVIFTWIVVGIFGVIAIAKHTLKKIEDRGLETTMY